MKYIFFICSLVIIVVSCKKDKKDNPGDKRIVSVSDGVNAQLLAYDDLKRISRIDYNAAFSLRFEYSAAGVFIQQYGAGNTPDPDVKYDFTIVGGRITSGHKYLANQRVNNFSYGYDGQQRLTSIYISLRFDGNEFENHFYTITYDVQNNVEAIAFRRRQDNENSDSMYISQTYFEGKSFITWRDMGFDYFGSAAFGQEHLGYGIIVPFYLLSHVYPSQHALKSQNTQRFSWNPVTKKWIVQGSNNFIRQDTEYVHDANGRLVKYFGNDIQWQ
jgi:hypothetical protein